MIADNEDKSDEENTILLIFDCHPACRYFVMVCNWSLNTVVVEVFTYRVIFVAQCGI